LRGFNDYLQYPRAIFQHIGIPEPRDAIALRLEPAIARRIAASFGMVAAIDLNDQTLVVAHKINNVSANWRLTAEAQAI
jgi:hypothetical protein